jgi:hypothetical protein
LAPAVFHAARPRRWSKLGRRTALAVGVLAVAALAEFGSRGLFLPNYLTPHGAYAGVDWDTGPHRTLFAAWIWWPVIVLACVSGALLAGLLVENRRAGACDRFLGLFTVITAVGTVVTNVIGQEVYDRYLLALAPAVLAMVLTPRDTATVEPSGTAARDRETRLARRLTIGAAAGLALFSLGTVTASFAWDAARWRTATRLTAQTDLPATKIDAGLEWVGWHSVHGVTDRNPSQPFWGWEDYLGTTPACRILTVGPDREHPDFQLLGTFSFKTFLLFGHSRLYYYDMQQPECP